MRKGNEKGAIVVEGLLSLTFFMFAIFTLLSLVNICYIQAKMSVALNSAAKEISQYSYFYYVFDIDLLDKKMAEGTEDKRKLADNTITGVGTLMDSLSSANNNLSTANFDGLVQAIKAGTTNVDSLVDQWADSIGDDPKAFVLGMGKMLGNELKEDGKKILCQVLAKAFMKKNLKAFPEDDPDQFLRRYNVVNGMAGLDFNYTSFLQNGSSNLIQLCVTYDVKVMELLNIDFTFTFRQCVKTTAWGRGISKIEPEKSMSTQSPTSTIWDTGPGARGKYIVEQEKKNFDYTDSGNGFDAYDSDENEFVSIISIDTNGDSYDTAEDIEGRLRAAYNDMSGKVEDLSEEITVTDENGNQVTLPSDPDTREYSIVLVVPDNADAEMIEQAIKQFQEQFPGVEVVVKDGYGSPTVQLPVEDTPEGGE